MLPFNFLAQDSGTLVNYYLSIIVNAQNANEFVIIRDSNGNPLVSAQPAGGHYNAGAVSQDNSIYSLSMGASLRGYIDESSYGAKIVGAQLFQAFKETSFLNSQPTGAQTAIPLDIPSILNSPTGSAFGLGRDIPEYQSSFSSGIVSGILIDSPNLRFQISGEQISGISIDNANCSIKLTSFAEEAYRELLNIGFIIGSGEVSRAFVLFSMSGEEQASVGFRFTDGNVFGAN